MSLKFTYLLKSQLFCSLYVTVILILFVRYKHETLMVKYAKPNQKLGFVHYNRDFAITVIDITEFDCKSVCKGPKF